MNGTENCLTNLAKAVLTARKKAVFLCPKGGENVTIKERLEKQLDVLEKAQAQAANDCDYEAVVKLSAQILAVAVCIEEN